MEMSFKKMVLPITIILLTFALIGCENEGSAEKAGKKVDQTIDSIKKKIDEAKE